MIAKVLAVAALAVANAPAVPQVAPPWSVALDTAATATGINPSLHPEVVRVDCLTARGTAFKVGPHTLVSVAHVTDNAGCFINGEPIMVLHKQGDFSVLYSKRVADKWLRIDCGGFVIGHTYIATGFARGLSNQTTVDLIATGEELAGFQRLWGVFTVVPGQSGGPVTDRETGKVVGTVNVYDARRGNSGSIALKDTSLCQSSDSARP